MLIAPRLPPVDPLSLETFDATKAPGLQSLNFAILPSPTTCLTASRTTSSSSGEGSAAIACTIASSVLWSRSGVDMCNRANHDWYCPGIRYRERIRA